MKKRERINNPLPVIPEKPLDIVVIGYWAIGIYGVLAILGGISLPEEYFYTKMLFILGAQINIFGALGLSRYLNRIIIFESKQKASFYSLEKERIYYTNMEYNERFQEDEDRSSDS